MNTIFDIFVVKVGYDETREIFYFSCHKNDKLELFFPNFCLVETGDMRFKVDDILLVEIVKANSNFVRILENINTRLENDMVVALEFLIKVFDNKNFKRLYFNYGVIQSVNLVMNKATLEIPKQMESFTIGTNGTIIVKEFIFSIKISKEELSYGISVDALREVFVILSKNDRINLFADIIIRNFKLYKAGKKMIDFYRMEIDNNNLYQKLINTFMLIEEVLSPQYIKNTEENFLYWYIMNNKIINLREFSKGLNENLWRFNLEYLKDFENNTIKSLQNKTS